MIKKKSEPFREYKTMTLADVMCQRETILMFCLIGLTVAFFLLLLGDKSNLFILIPSILMATLSIGTWGIVAFQRPIEGIDYESDANVAIINNREDGVMASDQRYK